jgi:hypothetical protein
MMDYSDMTIWQLKVERDKINAELELRTNVRASPSEADGEGWIAVIERMPQSSKNVLFWCGWLQLGYHLDVTDNWYGRGDEGFAIREKVTHWMPLPDAPGRSPDEGK